jgi:hypothetical protein
MGLTYSCSSEAEKSEWDSFMCVYEITQQSYIAFKTYNTDFGWYDFGFKWYKSVF